jgi:hypothetical protein
MRKTKTKRAIEFIGESERLPDENNERVSSRGWPSTPRDLPIADCGTQTTIED